MAEQRRHAVQQSNPDPADMQKATEALKVCSPVTELSEASCHACAVWRLSYRGSMRIRSPAMTLSIHYLRLPQCSALLTEQSVACNGLNRRAGLPVNVAGKNEEQFSSAG